MNEKQIDELARMLVRYIVSENKDIRLPIEFSDFVYGLIEANGKIPSPLHILDYFLIALRREYIRPEVIQREPEPDK